MFFFFSNKPKIVMSRAQNAVTIQMLVPVYQPIDATAVWALIMMLLLE